MVSWKHFARDNISLCQLSLVFLVYYLIIRIIVYDMMSVVSIYMAFKKQFPLTDFSEVPFRYTLPWNLKLFVEYQFPYIPDVIFIAE